MGREPSFSDSPLFIPVFGALLIIKNSMNYLLDFDEHLPNHEAASFHFYIRYSAYQVLVFAIPAGAKSRYYGQCHQANINRTSLNES